LSASPWPLKLRTQFIAAWGGLEEGDAVCTFRNHRNSIAARDFLALANRVVELVIS